MKVAANVRCPRADAILIRNWNTMDLGHPRPARPRTALYSGNLGWGHHLPSFLELCRRLVDEGYEVTVRGDGPGMKSLPGWVRREPLLTDQDALVRSYWEAEVHLVAGHPELPDAVFPSKIWNALAAGRPVLASGFSPPMLEELEQARRAEPRSHIAQWVSFVSTLLTPRRSVAEVGAPVVTRTRPRPSLAAVVVALLIVGSGVGSLLLGQDANTDLHRYRFYIGYAFVHGRLDADLVPAALGTFLNPTLDAFHYLGIAHLPPRLFGFLLGALQGLNPALVFLLARRLLDRGPGSGALAVLVGVLAATGPSAHSLLGTTMGDTTASIPFLLSLLVVLGDRGTPDERKGTLAWLGAGFLAGASVGLKITMGPHVVALGALVVLMALGRQVRVGAALVFLAGTVLGFAALGGAWCWRMWERFGNPVFPFANQIFRSPYLPAEAIRDPRWVASGPWDLLATPFAMALGETGRLQEIPFRDARFLLVLVAAFGWSSLRCLGKRTPLPPSQRNLLAFVLMAYGAWLGAFYYYRYAAVLEFLAPLVLVMLVPALLPRTGRPLLFATGACLLLSSSVGSWQRQDWSDRWWRVTLPAQADEADSLVLLDESPQQLPGPVLPGEDTLRGPRTGRLLALRRPGDRHRGLSQGDADGARVRRRAAGGREPGTLCASSSPTTAASSAPARARRSSAASCGRPGRDPSARPASRH